MRGETSMIESMDDEEKNKKIKRYSIFLPIYYFAWLNTVAASILISKDHGLAIPFLSSCTFYFLLALFVRPKMKNLSPQLINEIKIGAKEKISYGLGLVGKISVSIITIVVFWNLLFWSVAKFRDLSDVDTKASNSVAHKQQMVPIQKQNISYVASKPKRNIRNNEEARIEFCIKAEMLVSLKAAEDHAEKQMFKYKNTSYSDIKKDINEALNNYSEQMHKAFIVECGYKRAMKRSVAKKYCKQIKQNLALYVFAARDHRSANQRYLDFVKYKKMYICDDLKFTDKNFWGNKLHDPFYHPLQKFID